MKLACDLHIHSCLSPCSSPDMTPNNIVNMAKLKGLDVIAVSDHNHTGNLKAVYELSKKNNILLIPAIELETSEEIHMLCYFDSLDRAYDMQEVLNKNYTYIKNKENIFGEQWILNSDDEQVEKIEFLLSTATKLDLYNAVNTVREIGGVIVPAHVDRQSYSMLVTLGTVPEDLCFKYLELSKHTKKEDFIKKYKDFSSYSYYYSSDAHDLVEILEREVYFDIKEKNTNSFLSLFL